MKRDAIDLSTLNVFTLFRKYFCSYVAGYAQYVGRNSD